MEEKEAETGGTGRQPGAARGGGEDPALEGLRPQDTEVPPLVRGLGEDAFLVSSCSAGGILPLWLQETNVAASSPAAPE